MARIIECIPNFSEGRDASVVRRITDTIQAVEGVTLLDVDSGEATNRTVVTFAGEPEAVLEAAFQAVAVAMDLIDMRRHQGAHPRFGATDVCPIVPVRGVTMAEAVEYARHLADRVGSELEIPVYCYEEAALENERHNLATVRAGEYESLAERFQSPNHKPDYGPAVFNERTGALAVGARGPLIAFNVNLNTTSVRRTNSVAFDVRERGRVIKEDGQIVRDENGTPKRTPGSLKAVKAIGWYIEEYGICQVSMNLTDPGVTPLHVAFAEVCERARDRGLRVTGSEIVGLVPLEMMLGAGRYFLAKQRRSAGVSQRELLHITIRSMGLDELSSFKPEEKIVEYALGLEDSGPLMHLAASDLIDKTASEAPAPGGGSVSALVGSFGAALGTMVANLSANRRGWDDRIQEFSDLSTAGRSHIEVLNALVDADTAAFDGIMESYRMPRTTDDEQKRRDDAVEQATLAAIDVPLQVMRESGKSLELVRAMAERGNPACITDAGVGALCARTAVEGAFLNVQTNVRDLSNRQMARELLRQGEEILERVRNEVEEILTIVRNALNKEPE